ncbi:hypothetical protein BIV57_00975 [Mangrovactinospora gilvigrisea]|uniref:Activator of Hsp90 ATPase homologue 1/2-like C-terminal domain-containing protein n=1 Tax=Mangrovactinospora gilvigrisea TaxID=1428644 RepID=A0A1J7BL68_9ACTN|nr:SRPBCC domain-containing protein [Mangrovactinospora gilvigrisea]OIV39439.1 hypothetical protein BIV57_00975 [Mangrovactinospora gilvigrisea]
MAGTDHDRCHIQGSLHAAKGQGTVRIEGRFDTDLDDVWSALTEPDRLSRWLGEIHGDFRLGGELRARYYASGWEGTLRVNACEPHRRLHLVPAEDKATDDNGTEVTLHPDGHQTILVLIQHGVPLDLIAAFGTGNQTHVEDLAAHLAGRGRTDPDKMWAELFPGYENLAAALEQPSA